MADLAAVSSGRKDELALLAEKINTSFAELENTRTQQEEQARSLAEALEELRVRHSDLETAHLRLQQLQEVSASLGGSLEIGDALGQMEDVALGIFEADEVWLLRLQQPDQQQLTGLRAFSTHAEGYARLPRLFGCTGPDGVLSVGASPLLTARVQGRRAGRSSSPSPSSIRR